MEIEYGEIMIRSTLILFLCTILSKLLGFAREMVVAYKFGAGAITDAFVTTNSIPTVLFSALSVAIGINYIPVVSGIANKEERRNLFTSNIINLSLLIMLLGVVAILFFPRAVLFVFAGGLEGEAYNYAVNMLYITAFAIFPIVLSQILQSYLQVKNRFLSTGLTGIICNIVVIAFTLVSDERHYQLLSVGTVTSHMVMFLILAFEVRHTGYRHRFKVNVKDEYVRRLVLLTCPLMLETLLSEVGIIVDKNMASYLETGTITSLSYASNLVTMAYTMVVTSLLTTIFPRFSKYHAEEDDVGLKKDFIYYGDLLSIVIIPLGILMMALSTPIVELLFGRGAFDGDAVTTTGQCVFFYAMGVFAIGMKSYVIRTYYALQDTKTPTLYAAAALALAIVMKFVFVVPLRHMGLALSTSIANVVAYLLLSYKLSGKLGISWGKDILKKNLKIILMAGFSGIVVWGLYQELIGSINLLVLLILLVFIFCILYVGFLYLFKFYILKDAISYIWQRVRKHKV